jgi:uncharacterized protein YoaH (UPF0181 family)
MFYSQEEFQAQLKDLLAQGLSVGEAGAVVEQNMYEDEQEYIKWLDEENHVAEMNDNWYDEQFDVDFEHDCI